MNFIFLVVFYCFGAVDVSQIISAEDQGSTTTSIDQNLSTNYDMVNKENNLTKIHQILVFGAHLFNGN
ncbi:polysaccharide export protein, partial [Campylobacter jejuni]|nr:polysaccharide export protein [Campylobacter jejuni]